MSRWTYWSWTIRLIRTVLKTSNLKAESFRSTVGSAQTKYTVLGFWVLRVVPCYVYEHYERVERSNRVQIECPGYMGALRYCEGNQSHPSVPAILEKILVEAAIVRASDSSGNGNRNRTVCEKTSADESTKVIRKGQLVKVDGRSAENNWSSHAVRNGHDVLPGRALSPRRRRCTTDNICERSAADHIAAQGWSRRSAVVLRPPASIVRVPVVFGRWTAVGGRHRKRTPLPRLSCAPLRVVFTTVTVVAPVCRSVLLCVSLKTNRHRRMAKIVFPLSTFPQRNTAAFPLSTDCPHHHRRPKALGSGGDQQQPLFSSRLPSTGLRFVFCFFL